MPPLRRSEGLGAKEKSASKDDTLPKRTLTSKGLTRKPAKTVQLLEGTPCFLPACPGWLKAPSMWSPPMSPRVVERTVVGTGRYGSVSMLRHRATGHRAVAKQFIRERLLSSARVQDKVTSEWRVHSSLEHPHIVPLYGAVEDKHYVTLLMEAQEGDLLTHLDEQEQDVMPECVLRRVVTDVLCALAYMHEMGFVHRDIKPENVFAGPEPAAGLLPARTRAASVPRTVRGPAGPPPPAIATQPGIARAASAPRSAPSTSIHAAPPSSSSGSSGIGGSTWIPPPRPSIYLPGRLPPVVPRYPGTAAAAGAGGLTAGGLVGRGVGRGVGGLGTGLGGRAGAGAGKAAADGAGARGPLRWRLGDLGSAVELQEVARDGAPGLHLEGSVPFLAPEYAELWLATSRTRQQLQQATSPKLDIWGVGALVYDMLLGHPPYSPPDGSEPALEELVGAISSPEPLALPPPDCLLPHYHAQQQKHTQASGAAAAGNGGYGRVLSAHALDFLRLTLQKRPGARPSAEELLRHPWLDAV